MWVFDFSRGSPVVAGSGVDRSRDNHIYSGRALPVRELKDKTSAHLPKRQEPCSDDSFITYANGIV